MNINYHCFIEGLADIMSAQADAVVAALEPFSANEFKGGMSWTTWVNAAQVSDALKKGDRELLAEVLRRMSLDSIWELQYHLSEVVSTDTAGLDGAVAAMAGREASVTLVKRDGLSTYNVLIHDEERVLVARGNLLGYEVKELILEHMFQVSRWDLDYIWRSAPTWGELLDIIQLPCVEVKSQYNAEEELTKLYIRA